MALATYMEGAGVHHKAGRTCSSASLPPRTRMHRSWHAMMGLRSLAGLRRGMICSRGCVRVCLRGGKVGLEGFCCALHARPSTLQPAQHWQHWRCQAQGQRSPGLCKMAKPKSLPHGSAAQQRSEGVPSSHGSSSCWQPVAAKSPPPTPNPPPTPVQR